MNDMSAFDLNQLQMPNNRWELLLPGDNSPNMPAARTNHSVITYNDKMYLYVPTLSLHGAFSDPVAGLVAQMVSSGSTMSGVTTP